MGWKFGSNFQTERGFIYLAFAIVTMTIYFGAWGLQSMLSVAYLYTLNLFFETSLHIYDIIRYKIRSLQKYFHISCNFVIMTYLAYFALKAALS